MLSLSDKIQLGAIWSIECSAIVSNLFLILAIIFKTPKQLRAYSVFLLNNALVDLTTATASALAAVIENHKEFTCLFVFLGPCSLFSEHLCRMAHVLHINLLQHSTIILLLSFGYRLYILSDLFPTRPPPSRTQIWMLCLSPFLLIGGLAAGYYLEQTDPSDELLERLGIQGYSAANFDMMSTRVMYVNTTGCLISPITLSVIFVIRRRLLHRIAQSKATDKRQHEFIARALTYQALLPCAAATGCTIWLLDLSQIWSSEFSERFIIVMFSLFSLASPLINFTMLPPYRAMLPFSRTKIQTVGPNPQADFTTATSINTSASRHALSLADRIHLGINWSLDLSAIVANVLLIFAIIFKTPKQLRSYSVFLLNNALVDLTTATASALASVRVIENHKEFTMIFFFLGPCSLISENLCRIAHALHANLVQHSSVILLLSFAYRLYILSDLFPTRPPPSRTQTWILCLSSSIFIAILTVAYYLEENDASEELLSRFGLLGYSAANYNLMSTRVMNVSTTASLISPIVLTAIFVIRRKLLYRIAQSKATDKRQHESIARALTYQTLLPCAAAVGLSFWLLDAL